MAGEITYFVSGLWCSTCAKTLETVVSRSPGVRSSNLNYSTKLLQVEVDSIDLRDPMIVDAAKSAGFGVKRLTGGWIESFRDDLKKEMERRIPVWLTALVFFLSMWATMLAFTDYLGGLSARQEFVVCCLSSAFGLPAVLIGVQPFARAGLRALLRSRLLTLDLFVAIGALASGGLSLANLYRGVAQTYLDSSSMVLVVLLFTKHLETRLFRGFSDRILNRVEPLETSVWVFRKEWVERPVSQIRRGEKIKLVRGQTVPVDGRLECREAKTDTHLLNGERDTRTLSRGDLLSAGLVARTELEMTVLEPLGCRMIDRWAESALVSPSRKHAFSEQLGKIEERLVLFALAGSTVVALVRLSTTHSVTQAWLGFFVGVLVFCPCLFAGIMPLAKQMAHLALLNKGVVLQRVEALFDLAGIERIYLDKTGTLEGVESRFDPGIEESARIRNVYRILAQLQRESTHPILRGLDIPEFAKQEPLPRLEFNEYPGQGVVVRSADHGLVVIGRPEFVRGRPTPRTNEPFPLVAVDGAVVGALVTKSGFTRNGKEFLRRLLASERNWEVAILTGDPDLAPAEKYRGEGIRYHGNLSPKEKAEILVNPALFVGDGLNDTLVQAKAQVSCGLGRRTGNFTPVDFHLSNHDLTSLLDVLEYSQKFVRVLKQTAWAALLYNVTTLTLAAFGLFTPLGAVLAMLVSFTALLASVSRLSKKPRRFAHGDRTGVVVQQVRDSGSA